MLPVSCNLKIERWIKFSLCAYLKIYSNYRPD